MARLIDDLQPERDFPQEVHGVTAEEHHQLIGSLMAARTHCFEITGVADSGYHMAAADPVTLAALRRDSDDDAAPMVPDTAAFGAVAPPFDSYWMEWRTHGVIGELAADLGVGPRLGAMFVVTDATNDDAWAVIMACFGEHRGHARLAGHAVIEIPKDGTSPPVFIYHLGGPLIDQLTPQVRRHTALAEQVRAEIEAGAITDPGRLAEIADALDRGGRIIDRSSRVAGQMGRVLWYPPVLFAHALLMCSNVDTEEHHPEPKVSKARVRRGKPPLVTYRTLIVRGRQGGGRRVGLGDGQTAAHIVRGHFKTYTADAPLLGRATGRFFWPAHVAGNPAHGTVVKDYQLDPQ